MSNKHLCLLTAAFLAGATAVFGDGTLTTGSLILSGSQSFDGEAVIEGHAVVDGDPLVEANSEFSSVGTDPCVCPLVLSGESSFDGETVVTGGEIVEDAGVQAGDSDDSKDAVAFSCDGLVPTGESSFDGEVAVTGGRIAENERSVASTGTPSPELAYSSGIVTFSRNDKMSFADTSSSPGEAVVVGGKLIKNELAIVNAVEEVAVINAESPVEDDKAISASGKLQKSKDLNVADDNDTADASGSAKSAVLKGGRVFLR